MNFEKKKAKEMIKDLYYERSNFWKVSPKVKIDRAFDFCDGYKSFLDSAKTERETINYFQKKLEEHNFVEVNSGIESKKLYTTSRNKNAAFSVIGNSPISEGVNIIVSHVDSPRVDLKQNPVSEDKETELGLLKTHYYGGIKKYQWLSTPLALHGVFIKKDGTKVSVCIGEGANDPVLCIPDILPHLAHKVQAGKKISEAVDGSKMKVIAASMPFIEKDEKIKNAVKLNIMYLLNQRYDITEKDFLSAELELVPAGKAKDAGLDCSFILGYGQDDRICAYTSAEAIFELENPNKTAIVYLADKEEIGSEGNTGAKSNFIINFIADLLAANGEKNDSNTVRKTLINSQIISADVNAAINPNWASVHEPENAVHIGFGVSVTKFTGSRGKSGSNDCNAEFNAKIIHLFDDEGINWQTGALGKVDEGGGGTIAKYMAEYGAEVLDCGPGVLGMHSLYELTSKADIYSTFLAYNAFLRRA